MKEKIYETDDLIITWQPERCQHAAKCVDGAPQVFDVERRPWLMPEKGTTEQITTIIDQCPSGALQYRRKSLS